MKVSQLLNEELGELLYVYEVTAYWLLEAFVPSFNSLLAHARTNTHTPQSPTEVHGHQECFTEYFPGPVGYYKSCGYIFSEEEAAADVEFSGPKIGRRNNQVSD